MEKFVFFISIVALLGAGCLNTQQAKTLKADNSEYFAECNEKQNFKMEEQCNSENLSNLSIKDLLACHAFTNNKEGYLLFYSNCVLKQEIDDLFSDFTKDTSINNLTTSSQYIIQINNKCSQKIINLTPKELIGCVEYFRPDLSERNIKE